MTPIPTYENSRVASSRPEQLCDTLNYHISRIKTLSKSPHRSKELIVEARKARKVLLEIIHSAGA